MFGWKKWAFTRFATIENMLLLLAAETKRETPNYRPSSARQNVVVYRKGLWAVSTSKDP